MNWKWPSVWSDERGGWWRVPVTCVCFGATFFLVGSFLVGEFKKWGIQDAVKGGSAGLKAGVQMFLWVFPLCFSGVGCLFGIRLVHRKPISVVFTDGRPFQFKLFFQSCAVWGVLWSIGVVLFPGGLEALRSRYHEIRPSSWPGVCFALFAVITLQAATEEIVNRGYLQTRIAAWVKRPWLAVCFSTILFTSLHTGKISTPARVDIALIGLALGIALIRANTIAPLVGMHTTLNALGLIWLPDWTNANRNWLDVGFTGVQLIVWLAWLFWATKPKPEPKKISLGSEDPEK